MAAAHHAAALSSSPLHASPAAPIDTAPSAPPQHHHQLPPVASTLQ
eukprot:CAMPEP_0173103126 /NCGR_PEP_ID=MMETSP1102-20130122/38128_1 /TAXON_ID=49646 /ORGANISM="Geminigera sp., Strain Caron Lab Isolate" /LENGTH=45 /DNA_ID= /DNA_START= /DNA_END= /DNA_ORIENTATION=